MANTSKPMSPVDTAWLHMEHPTNLMMVTGVALLRPPVDLARIRETFEVRLLRFDRFRMRVVENNLPLGAPHWAPDPTFDLDSHIHRVALPGAGGMAELQTFLGDLSSAPLDFSKPLWQLHLVENVLGGVAMVLRFHHCIGDGLAMTAVMYELMDTEPDAKLERLPEPEVQRAQGRSVLRTLLRPLRFAFGISRSIAGTIVHESFECLRHPSHLAELTGGAAQITGSAAENIATLARMALQPPDNVTCLKGRLGVQKQTAWSKAVPLADVKAIGKATDASVNDVLAAAVTGALRAYLAGRDEQIDGLEIRAVVPVNLRAQEQALTLGNEFGLVWLTLPIFVEDPILRLQEVKRRMDAIKNTPEAVVAIGVLFALGLTPQQIEDQIVNLFCAQATLVLTNVMGPTEPLYMAGSRIENMMFWVPQAGRLSMGISILSYGGQVTLGVISDAGLAPDPAAITAQFEREFEILMEETTRSSPALTTAG